MESVSDIVVLDFCEWLNKKLRYKRQRPPIIDIILGDGDNNDLLTQYAHEYLDEPTGKNRCTFYRRMMMFFKSEEFKQAQKECDSHWCNECCSRKFNDLDYCLHCPIIQSSFRRFCRHLEEHYFDSNYSNVTAEQLASSIRWLFLYNVKDTSYADNYSPLMHLMTASYLELSEELNFFNWLEKQLICATDIRKMPSTIYGKMVDLYVIENKKTEHDRKRLLTAYQKTGWEELLEKFKVLFRANSHPSKNLSDTLERYCCHYGRYKCIILPRSDNESQKIYTSLITDSWEDLNACSGEYLDIYYSEQDTGKSGFDIANRIAQLPERLKSEVPSLIIWKDSIDRAEEISISRLDNTQIVDLINTIVKSIKSEKSFKMVIQEARDKMKELQQEKKSITNNHYDVNVHYGQAIIAGDNTTVNATNNIGVTESKLSELLSAVRTESGGLSKDDKEAMDESLEVIEAEIQSGKPRKSFLKTAVTTLKTIAGTAEFAAAVAALIQFVQTFIP